MEEIAEVCRICLEKDSEEMHKIFDECLNNKIVILTGLDVRKIFDFIQKNNKISF